MSTALCSGGSEANHLTLWTLLEHGDHLAFMLPNYLQGWGLGRHFLGSNLFWYFRDPAGNYAEYYAYVAIAYNGQASGCSHPDVPGRILEYGIHIIRR